MHSWIQNHILLELTKNATRRYSQLRPRDVEGNLFMYHLHGLIREGLVEKSDGDYTLSSKGLRFIGTYSLEAQKTRKQPKILTAVVAKNENGEHLFVTWRRQPNIGQVSFPHGMMHYGEKAADMAATELAEKAGLTGTLAYRGDVYVRGYLESELDRHMIVHVFEATDLQKGRENELRPEVSEHFWAKFEDLSAGDFVPGFYEIAKIALAEKGTFFKEIEVDIPQHKNPAK